MTGSQLPSDHSKHLNQRLDLDFALQAAGLGVWEVDPATNLVTWDERCRQLFGLAQDNPMTYEQAIHYIHPEDRPRMDRAVRWAMNAQSGGHYDQTYRTIGADDGQLRWVRFFGRGYFDEAGQVYRFAGVGQEVTQQILAQQKLAESEARFRSLVEEAPVATALLVGPQLRIEVANSTMLSYWGQSQAVLGLPFREALTALAGQGFFEKLDEVLTTGQSFRALEAPAQLPIAGQTGTAYFDFSFKPLFSPTGEVYAILNTAIDVTSRVLARRQEEETQRQVLALFEQSQVGIAIIHQDNLTFHLANPFYGYLVGRTPQALVGKPLLEALPELAGQGFETLLQEVLATGTPFNAKEVKVEVVRHGQLETIWVDLTYQPRREADTRISGILVVATDVTQQVLTRQKVEESEQHLELLRDTVPAMIFYLDEQQRYQSYNQVFRDWFGVAGEEAIGQTVRAFLGEEAYQKTEPHLARAYAGQPERYELFAPSRMKEDRWLSIVYTPHKNEANQVTGLIVLATDITPSKRVEGKLRRSEERYRQLSAQLEQQVQQRTQELAAANEALRATNAELGAHNDEYAAINRELAEANFLLNRSNDNLQQFAFVASHDLQEPLRKIQQFGDILRSQYGPHLGDGIDYLQRMQSAAARMSTLIKDLLAYSRIATQAQMTQPVSLDTVLQTVLTDLELVITETGGVIEVNPLPTVLGDATQLGQLFANLLSNALKFRQPGVVPGIQVGARWLAAEHLPGDVKPSRRAIAYYQIDVADNGIGFEEKHLDRIFQVFQRLHGRSAYAGTGIGLAICEKVVANHGGAITARSRPGHGATFRVYLPV